MKSSPFLLAMLALVPAARGQTDDIVRARNPLPLHSDGEGYDQTFALIIGVNYDGRQDELATAADRKALPTLLNAENDARGFRDTLVRFYGYEEANCVTLIGEQASYAEIETQIGRLCDRSRVQPSDSVVLFFSGHGLRLDNTATRSGNAVAILPYDVQLSGGIPTGNFLRVPRSLVERLQEIPARHKLLILDCCYSGEIFNVSFEKIGFQPRSKDRRSDAQLLGQETFQAIASCRATQVASDGSGDHSPFTAALLDGLKRLPARDSENRHVWSNRLLAHIRPNFPADQLPDCRNLFGSDGEFCFYPDPAVSFDQFKITLDEQNLLKATVASHQGNWWFEEMPWFIPGVREQIIRVYETQQDKKRTAEITELIEPGALQSAAETALNQPAQSPLDAMRQRHARLLLETYTTKDFSQSLTTILADLAAETLELEAPDLHLRGVVQHALSQKKPAQDSYEQAITTYAKAIAEHERPLLHILQALCHADLAELLLDEMNEAKPAAEHYQEAHRLIQLLAGETGGPQHATDAAAIFRIYVLCREADAFLKLNQWSQANDRLLRALDMARSFAPDHYLTAHVHRRTAWAEIIQQRYRDAVCSFRRSNEILAALFRTELGLSETLPERPSSEEIAESELPPPSAESFPACASDETGFVLPATFHRPGSSHRPSDFRSRAAYLHNLHGIAMAKRFQGESRQAAVLYRSLTGLVEQTLSQSESYSVDDNTREQLIGRVINTQERLGDCNLFGDPQDRDLAEAADDYRRALNRVHQLSASKRDRWLATLWYKQALARSLPSPLRDTELALEMCRRADEIFIPDEEKATGLYLALGKLTTVIVRLMVADDRGSDGDSRESAAAELRRAIHEFRDHDNFGAHPHRDQLELALFASKALLEQGGESLEQEGDENRYQVLEDAALLLSFCRIALSPYQSGPSPANPAGSAQPVAESRAYLRPYYDAIMHSKLRVAPNHVKDLLEIQWEATNGTPYFKHQQTAPTLAIYVLDGEWYLLVDVPRGVSKCVSLAEFYDVDSIHQACRAADEKLPLPREVHRSLARWVEQATQRGESVFAYCYCEETLRGTGGSVTSLKPIPEASSLPGGPDSDPIRERYLVAEFPFELPPGFNPPLYEVQEAQALGTRVP